MCLKLSDGRRPGLIESIHSWKRAGRPPLRLLRVRVPLRFSLAVSPASASASADPPKLPQFSDTLARSDSMSGGDTTCSHTRPRSSLMEDNRLG